MTSKGFRYISSGFVDEGEVYSLAVHDGLIWNLELHNRTEITRALVHDYRPPVDGADQVVTHAATGTLVGEYGPFFLRDGLAIEGELCASVADGYTATYRVTSTPSLVNLGSFPQATYAKWLAVMARTPHYCQVDISGQFEFTAFSLKPDPSRSTEYWIQLWADSNSGVGYTETAIRLLSLREVLDG